MKSTVQCVTAVNMLYKGTSKSSWKMHIMKKLYMDFNFLHQNKLILTCDNMSEQDPV